MEYHSWIRLKQHSHKMFRNGQQESVQHEYEVIVTPKRLETQILNSLRDYVKNKKGGGSFDFNTQTKFNEGVLPSGYNCWCAVIEDFLFDNDYVPDGASSFDKVEKFIKLNNAKI